MPGLMPKPLGFLVVIFLIIGCGDDSGNGPIDNTARFDQIADALTGAESDLITSNADITASLEYFTPFIAATLGLGQFGRAGESSGQQTCLPASVLGKIYNFNGTSYVADLDTGVTEFNTRFRLYRISMGEPVLEQRIGHIEFYCIDAGVRVAEIRIVSGAVLVASVTYSQQTRIVTGGIRSSDGTKDMLIEGAISIEGDLELNFLLEEDDIQATYGFSLFGTGTRIAHATIIGPYPEPDWGFFVDVTVDGDDDVTSGAAYFRIEPDVFGKVAACIASGTLASPVFTAPTPECPISQADRLAVTAAQLQDMAEAYHSLHELWTGVSGLVQANLAILALGG